MENEKQRKPMVLVFDTQNMLHRARSGMRVGEHHVTYNFFRSVRSIVEKLKPTRVYFALEGHAHHRHLTLPTYKANRAVEPGSKKELESKDFYRQADECIALLQKKFPVSVVRHIDCEADDTIYNLIKSSSTAVPWTVVSTDTDFLQLFDSFMHVELYNPVKGEFVEPYQRIRDLDEVGRLYNYVEWKALRGDKTDNVPGIPGVGDKTALALVLDKGKLSAFFKEDPTRFETFERNISLISFKTWTEEEAAKMESWQPEKAWDEVKQAFQGMGFFSITNDKSWAKFVSTFDPLWG